MRVNAKISVLKLRHKMTQNHPSSHPPFPPPPLLPKIDSQISPSSRDNGDDKCHREGTKFVIIESLARSLHKKQEKYF